MSDEEDVSAGTVSEKEKGIANYELDRARDTNRFRRILFWAIVVVDVLFYTVMLYYLLCLSWQDEGTERVQISVLLGVIPTLLTLALMRYLFVTSGGKKEAGDVLDLSITKAVIKELVEAAKK